MVPPSSVKRAASAVSPLLKPSPLSKLTVPIAGVGQVDDVRAVAAIDEVVADAVGEIEDENVVAVVALQQIVAGAALQGVVASAAAQGVRAEAAFEKVRALVAGEPIVAIAAETGYRRTGRRRDCPPPRRRRAGRFPESPSKLSAPLAAQDGVVALVAGYRVVAGLSVDHVALVAVRDGIVAVGAGLVWRQAAIGRIVRIDDTDGRAGVRAAALAVRNGEGEACLAFEAGARCEGGPCRRGCPTRVPSLGVPSAEIERLSPSTSAAPFKRSDLLKVRASSSRVSKKLVFRPLDRCFAWASARAPRR